jgi:hypothetical protein
MTCSGRSWHRLAIAASGLLVLLLAIESLAQTAKRPLSLADIEKLLRSGVTPARVTALVDERGVSFAATPGTADQLRGAGADAGLIGAVERAALKEERRQLDEERKRLEAARKAADPPRGRASRSGTARRRTTTTSSTCSRRSTRRRSPRPAGSRRRAELRATCHRGPVRRTRLTSASPPCRASLDASI